MNLSSIIAVTVIATLMTVASCSGGGTSTSAGTSAGWAVKWCQAQPGMSKDQLAGIMGPPTSSPRNELDWSDDHWRFYAHMNQDGTARQLDINQVDLTAAEKAGLQCSSARSRKSMEARAAEAHRDNRAACEILPQAKMSEILGSPVAAEASGRHKCIYSASASDGPYVEFSFDAGDGASGMAGAGMAGNSQPGLTNPLAGLGDQAVAAGPALFIRTGDDLVTIVTNHVSDRKAAAQKILEAVKSASP